MERKGELIAKTLSTEKAFFTPKYFVVLSPLQWEVLFTVVRGQLCTLKFKASDFVRFTFSGDNVWAVWFQGV